MQKHIQPPFQNKCPNLFFLWIIDINKTIVSVVMLGKSESSNPWKVDIWQNSF